MAAATSTLSHYLVGNLQQPSLHPRLVVSLPLLLSPISQQSRATLLRNRNNRLRAGSLKDSQRSELLQEQSKPEEPPEEGASLEEEEEEEEGVSTTVKGTIVATAVLLAFVGAFGALGFVYKEQINDILTQFSDFLEGRSVGFFLVNLHFVFENAYSADCLQFIRVWACWICALCACLCWLRGMIFSPV